MNYIQSNTDKQTNKHLIYKLFVKHNNKNQYSNISAEIKMSNALTKMNQPF